jgi:signal peptidase I
MAPLRRFWHHPWGRPFVLALALLFLLHQFVLRFVTVQSTSMFATLHPGDLLLVERWPCWTGFDRGDLVVFRNPLSDQVSRWRRPLMVKRIAALPGDTVAIRHGRLFVNGHAMDPEPGLTWAYLLRLRDTADAAGLFARHGLPMELINRGRTTLEVPLSEALAQSLAADRAVAGLAPMRLADGPQAHIFPFSSRYPWNTDDFGPLVVPKAGDTVRIGPENLPIYDRVITVYEERALSNSSKQLLVDGEPLEAFPIRKDYYFVLGDNRHYSSDSRHWGFVPADHLVGRGASVIRWR